MKTIVKLTPYIVFLLLLIGVQSLSAQPGPSFSASYDFYPYSSLANPDNDTFLKNVKIRVATLKLKASYPMAISRETFLMHEILYDRFDMDYKNWDTTLGGPEIPHGHAIKYNLMIMKTLSEKWSLLVFITPGLASDFRSKLSKDDVTIEAALVFVRKYSEKFSLGFGAAYSRQFGKPFPMPVLALEWNNGSNLKASAILPVNLELWYIMSPKIDIGLVLAGDGNMYHGDEKRYGGTKPRMNYSVLTFGPSLKYRFSKIFSLNVDGGYTFLRTFEFTNEIGGNEVKNSFDLKNTGYVRIGFQIGG